MTSKFRWGILGTGGIAAAFTQDVQRFEDHVVAAVGSRSQESADKFADRFDIASRHGSYEALVNDPDVDGIYVATPHPFHKKVVMLALSAGKAVLCEKPFAMSYAESKEMVDLARSKSLLLMEAMWTRHLPHILEVRKIVESGVLGRIVSIQADHGQWFKHDPEFRLFAPKLGGGALLDLGIYPISFASMILGEPSRITARATKTDLGVDEQTSVILDYKSGAQAILTTTLAAATPNRAVIAGTEARIEIDRTFYAPSTFKVISNQETLISEWKNEYPGHGLAEQALEFARCFRAGLTESPRITLDETLSIMKTMDQIMSQIDLTYPL